MLSGCDYELSKIKTGYISNAPNEWVSSETPNKIELSKYQTEKLNAWFANHTTGWETKITDNPPGMIIYIVHENDETRTVNLLKDHLWISTKYLILSDEEINELKTIIETKQG